MQSTLVKLLRQHPTPDKGDESFWQMLRMQAAMSQGLPRMCLQHGHIFAGQKPKAPKRWGAEKQCFQNAASLVQEDASFVYVEGLASTHTVGITFHHAWVLTPEGEVLDPTWKNGRDYCGLAFQRDALLEIIFESKKWGVFGNYGAPSWVGSTPKKWLHPAWNRNLQTIDGKLRR